MRKERGKCGGEEKREDREGGREGTGEELSLCRRVVGRIGLVRDVWGGIEEWEVEEGRNEVREGGNEAIKQAKKGNRKGRKDDRKYSREAGMEKLREKNSKRNGKVGRRQ